MHIDVMQWVLCCLAPRSQGHLTAVQQDHFRQLMHMQQLLQCFVCSELKGFESCRNPGTIIQESWCEWLPAGHTSRSKPRRQIKEQTAAVRTRLAVTILGGAK